MCVNSFLAEAVRNVLFSPYVFQCVTRQAQAGLDQVALNVRQCKSTAALCSSSSAGQGRLANMEAAPVSGAHRCLVLTLSVTVMQDDFLISLIYHLYDHFKTEHKNVRPFQ